MLTVTHMPFKCLKVLGSAAQPMLQGQDEGPDTKMDLLTHFAKRTPLPISNWVLYILIMMFALDKNT